MNSTAPQPTSAPPPRSATSIAARRRGSDSLERPTWREVIAQTAPMLDAPAFFGPPIVFVLSPWLLLMLLLIGPFALALTILLALAIAAGLVAVLVAAIASPYLLIRHLHARGLAAGKAHAPMHLFRKHRAGAGGLGSLQPKGMS